MGILTTHRQSRAAGHFIASVAAFAAALLFMTGGAVPSTASAAPGRAATFDVNVTEAFVSAESPDDELDSLVTWAHPDGRQWLIATAKSSHRLVIFDAESGQRIRDFGGKGAAAGQFLRPNGIAVFGDKLFVTERDNHRVQVLQLPELTPLGSFGEDALRSPYGLWIRQIGKGVLEVFVTDNFMLGARYDVVPPFEQLNQRVRRYHISFDANGKLQAVSRGHFGDTREDTALRVVESIAGDTHRQRLLIADEDTRHLSTLREYDFDGHYTGRSTPRGTFEAEAEGIALWSCNKRSYWIAVDQKLDRTQFHVLDRKSLTLLGSFHGQTVAQTDGITLRTAPTTRFPRGALFAVHRDKAIAAFDLHDVAKALRLDCSKG